MEEQIYNEKLEAGEIEEIKEEPEPLPTEPKEEIDIEQYVPFLEKLKNILQHITSAPTDTPQGFLSQFRFYLSGGVYRVYVSIDKVWKKIYDSDEYGKLTGGSHTVLHAHGRGAQMIVFDFTTDVATGNGKFYFHIDSRINGMNLVDVHAEVITAGTTGTTDIQIHNATDGNDMLSTKLTIDSGETGSDTAAATAVIDTAKDDVVTNDVLRIDVDAVSTTPPKGLVITLGFEKP
jgi:hypothetical protein